MPQKNHTASGVMYVVQPGRYGDESQLAWLWPWPTSCGGHSDREQKPVENVAYFWDSHRWSARNNKRIISLLFENTEVV